MPRPFTEREEKQIRGRLLEAGRDALPKTGFRRTAVEDVTRAAGISKGAFYRFFETKEALWVTLLEECEAEARATVLAALDGGGPERLRRVLEAMFRAVWANPTLQVLADPEELAWLTRTLPTPLLASARADDDVFFGNVWQALVRDGDVADDVPVQVFAGLPGVALALARQEQLIGPDRADAVRDLVIEALVLRLGQGTRTTRRSS